jgi:hypothetical protein
VIKKPVGIDENKMRPRSKKILTDIEAHVDMEKD